MFDVQARLDLLLVPAAAETAPWILPKATRASPPRFPPQNGGLARIGEPLAGSEQLLIRRQGSGFVPHHCSQFRLDGNPAGVGEATTALVQAIFSSSGRREPSTITDSKPASRARRIMAR